MINGDNEPKQKKWILVTVFVALGLIVIGSGVGLATHLVHNNDGNTEAETETEETMSLSEQVVDYLLNEDSDIDVTELKRRLNLIIRSSDDRDEVISAALNLISLGDDEGENVALLEGLMGDASNDQERYRLLKGLLVVYQNSGNSEKYRQTMTRMLELPDEMVLEYENWPMIKEMFKEELSSLEGGEDEE